MKTNNWQKNVRENYNAPVKEFNKQPEQPKSILSGKRVEVWRDDVNHALRKLKKILERDGQQKDLAKNEFYEKPSVRRKRRKDVAKSRWNREVSTMRAAGTWVDKKAADEKWQKSKRKRRKYIDLLEKTRRTRK